MNVQFLPEARAELIDAVGYYEGEASGLGLRLWDEVDQHIVWIERNTTSRAFGPAATVE